MSFLGTQTPQVGADQRKPTYHFPVEPDPSLSDEELVYIFKRLIERCWMLRERYAQLWLYCAAFLRGDQWFEWDNVMRDSASRREILPPGVEDAKTVDNQLPIYYNKHQVYFRQAMPKLHVEPPSMDSPLDRLAAELLTRLLEVRLDPDMGNERALRMRVVRLILLFGEALARVQWDADALQGRGDALMEIVDVFGYLKDPWSVDRWPPRFLIEMDCRHLEEIHDIYGVYVNKDSGLVQRTQYYDALALNIGTDQWQQPRPPMEDAAMVYRIGFPPSMRYPGGMCFHLVGDQILRRHGWQGGIWPYVRAVWQEMEMNLYGVGLIEGLLIDQIQRNILTCVGFETAIIKARGDLWTTGPDHKPRQHVYNKRTGATVTHLGAQVQVTPRQTGMEFKDARYQLELSDDNMHRKANLPRPSLGQPLEKERTLGAQVLSQQTAGTDAGEKVEEFGEDFLVPIATRELILYNEYAVHPREIDMGVGGGVYEFTNRDLRGAIKVKSRVAPHMSPAQKRSMIATARVEGLMPPYPTARDEASARQVLKQLGLDSLERLIEEQSIPLEGILQLAQTEQRILYELRILQAFAAKQQIEAVLAQVAAMSQRGEQEGELKEVGEEEEGGVLPAILTPQAGPGVGESGAVQQTVARPTTRAATVG